jgi:antitoxin MazE
MAIRSKIVRIGNSQGVRLSRTLLEQSGLSGEVDIEVREGEIVLHGIPRVREGWEEAYLKMASSGDDELLDPDAAVSDSAVSDSADSISADWDETEWEWE